MGGVRGDRGRGRSARPARRGHDGPHRFGAARDRARDVSAARDGPGYEGGPGPRGVAVRVSGSGGGGRGTGRADRRAAPDELRGCGSGRPLDPASGRDRARVAAARLGRGWCGGRRRTRRERFSGTSSGRPRGCGARRTGPGICSGRARRTRSSSSGASATRGSSPRSSPTSRAPWRRRRGRRNDWYGMPSRRRFLPWRGRDRDRRLAVSGGRGPVTRPRPRRSAPRRASCWPSAAPKSTRQYAALAYARKSLELADTPEARRFAVEVLWRGPVARILDPEKAVEGLTASGTVPLGLEPVFSPDSSWFALQNDASGRILLFSSDGAATRVLPRPPDGNAQALAFGPRSDVLITGGGGTSLRFLSLPDLHETGASSWAASDSKAWVSGERLMTVTRMSREGMGQVLRAWPFPGGEPETLATGDWTGPYRQDRPGWQVARGCAGSGALPSPDRRTVPVAEMGSRKPRGRSGLGQLPWFPSPRGGRRYVGQVREHSDLVLAGECAAGHDREAGGGSDGIAPGHRSPGTLPGRIRGDRARLLWDLHDPPDAEPLVLSGNRVREERGGCFRSTRAVARHQQHVQSPILASRLPLDAQTARHAHEHLGPRVHTGSPLVVFVCDRPPCSAVRDESSRRGFPRPAAGDLLLLRRSAPRERSSPREHLAGLETGPERRPGPALHHPGRPGA